MHFETTNNVSEASYNSCMEYLVACYDGMAITNFFTFINTKRLIHTILRIHKRGLTKGFDLQKKKKTSYFVKQHQLLLSYNNFRHKVQVRLI